MFIILLIIVMLFVTPFTMEIKTDKISDNCKHVIVQSWFGLIKTFEGDLCGDQTITLDTTTGKVTREKGGNNGKNN